jgi:hypothetical protein
MLLWARLIASCKHLHTNTMTAINSMMNATGSALQMSRCRGR